MDTPQNALAKWQMKYTELWNVFFFLIFGVFGIFSGAKHETQEKKEEEVAAAAMNEKEEAVENSL